MSHLYQWLLQDPFNQGEYQCAGKQFSSKGLTNKLDHTYDAMGG